MPSATVTGFPILIRVPYHGAMTSSHQTPASRSGAGTRQPPEHLQVHLHQLSVAVESVLRAQPPGLSELELIRTLQASPWQLIGSVDYSNPSALYPVHFLLFHVLYQLRDELAGQGEKLDISPLAIRLGPMPAATSGERSRPASPDRADPLRAFYLDLEQYHLSDDAVQRMVDDFWAGRSARPEQESVQDACSALGLDAPPPDFQVVKHRYRRAVMDAHPDRGGSTAEIQAINHAFATLRHHYRAQ